MCCVCFVCAACVCCLCVLFVCVCCLFVCLFVCVHSFKGNVLRKGQKQSYMLLSPQYSVSAYQGSFGVSSFFRVA
eukprot:TRINITY_DN10114_c0_g1_i1.p1 TRINITY_DN10114_c0_g1~~TRINITY_DN10114_c0_g1_i1.p1  ORF type:complete len:75 (-),score=12.39 TRINITY_DN10114_c0_g1_i1:168-392(-)